MGGAAGVSDFFYYESKFKRLFFWWGCVCVWGGGGLELVNFSFKESKSKKRFFIILGGRGARGSEFFKKESLSN